MSIPIETRDRSLAAQRDWYGRHGAVQLHLEPADVDDGGWKRHGRCGGWNADAPDPEIFFPVKADHPNTYTAQTFCAECPVRRYCDEAAARVRSYGVWGGIHRDESGRVSPVCNTARCLRYRDHGRKFCRQCLDVQALAKADEAAARQARIDALTGGAAPVLEGAVA